MATFTALLKVPIGSRRASRTESNVGTPTRKARKKRPHTYFGATDQVQRQYLSMVL